MNNVNKFFNELVK